jgi:hypothetical protein
MVQRPIRKGAEPYRGRLATVASAPHPPHSDSLAGLIGQQQSSCRPHAFPDRAAARRRIIQVVLAPRRRASLRQPGPPASNGCGIALQSAPCCRSPRSEPSPNCWMKRAVAKLLDYVTSASSHLSRRKVLSSPGRALAVTGSQKGNSHAIQGDSPPADRAASRAPLPRSIPKKRDKRFFRQLRTVPGQLTDTA